jgi:hypothetical protein
MKKSADVSKYEPQWQVIRSIVKGNFNNDLDKKFSLVENYFKQTHTYDRWERVYNWSEGLQRGFKNKNQEKVGYIQEKLDYLMSLKPNKENICYSIDYDILKNYDDKILIDLFKDLLKRNITWLKDGYFNKELNEFIDIVLLYIENKNSIEKQIISLDEYRKLSKTIKCTYKFIFY